MTVTLVLLSALLVVMVAVCGWLCGIVRKQGLDIEKLYDYAAQLAQDQAKMRKGMGEITKKLDETALTQEELAENISKQVEKVFDSGLQNMLAWNPFDTGESEGR